MWMESCGIWWKCWRRGEWEKQRGSGCPGWLGPERSSRTTSGNMAHRVEFVNALQLHVFVGKQPGNVRVTLEQSSVALQSFREDISLTSFLHPARISEPMLERQAEELSLRHTARLGFRTYDLLHVASALLLGCDHFWSFDERALKLARLEGLKTPPRKRR